MWSIFKNQKFWCVVAGAAGVVVGKKIVTAKKTRELAVAGLAKGMQIQNNAKETLQNIKEEAEDICYDARLKAELEEDGISETECEETEETAEDEE